MNLDLKYMKESGSSIREAEEVIHFYLFHVYKFPFEELNIRDQVISMKENGKKMKKMDMVIHS